MLLYQIGLTLLPGFGDIMGKKLVAYCGGVEAVFKEKRKVLEKVPGVGRKLIDSVLSQNVLSRAEEEISFIQKNNIRPIFYLDQDYPTRLKHCVDSPIMLYYKGNKELNVPKVVSVVGTRKATTYGKEMCEKIIKGLVSQKVLVVSGLAYGIDTCAHRVSLENNLNTVAVLGHGLDRIYPYLNRPLAEKIADHGGLVTEFMSQTIPDRENFPKRNRVIAGLSDATVVVEAANSGGALITAEIANSYNRDVFSVPGRIGDTWSEGCNKLIKINKAHLVQSAQDITYIMGWETKVDLRPVVQRQLFIELSPDEEKITSVLRNEESKGIDDICLQVSLPASRVSAALLNLEFQGLVRVYPGKMYKLDM